MTFEIEAYLEHHANKFTGQFDPNAICNLSRARAISSTSPSTAARSEAGLAKVRFKRALIVGVTTDFLFPIHQQRDLAEGLGAPGARSSFVELNSLQGHDSFLVDMDSYRPLIAAVLRVAAQLLLEQPYCNPRAGAASAARAATARRAFCGLRSVGRDQPDLSYVDLDVSCADTPRRDARLSARRRCLLRLRRGAGERGRVMLPLPTPAITMPLRPAATAASMSAPSMFS
jgi:hypothetical protein